MVEGFYVFVLRVVIIEKVSRVNKKSLFMKKEEWVFLKILWLGWVYGGGGVLGMLS